ncbi:MAG TPA: tRNA uridine-5-carboxymethylaminomethyl(34) synthesis GTPase MnmE [Nitrospiraceae bacterium]|nr:tRNA uridine-5-carboxymethylaminomethyl(34) synthesis GTPase MnmE [Nitrospiraceae bacterium]
MSGGLDDTICAVATPPGEGGVGILRLSGADAIEIAGRLANLRCRKSLASVRSHTLYLADLAVRAGHSGAASAAQAVHPRAQTFDEALVVVMRGPRSFTGEDVVEFHCHGGPLILHTLCEAIVAAGGRLAEPGEFTKRAFLNGRMDLAQAEAVLDTIRAKTAGSLRIAEAQRRGLLSHEIEGIRNELIGALAHVEAGLDFAEEDIAFVRRDELIAMLERANQRVSALLETAQEGRIWREGAAVAIVGRPNVGKSSLMNALARTDRAIVTAVPGTTRDVLDEWLHINGMPVRLLDTAGIRDTEDPIEQEGIRRTGRAIEEADLVIALIDQSAALEEADRTLVTRLCEKKHIVVLNKSDLPSGLQPDLWFGAYFASGSPLRISAATGAGLDELRALIRAKLASGGLEAGDGLCVTHLRHSVSLQGAREALLQARAALQNDLTGEFVAADLRRAADALGEITGAISTDDILDRIFSEFCIGK